MLVDTGPLVAILDDREPTHELCARSLAAARGDLGTTWPVLAEALHLMGRRVGIDGQTAVLDLIRRGTIALIALDGDAVAPIAERMRRYADAPMDLADATLVEAAERTGDVEILTLDAHFHAYRLSRGRRLRVLPA